MIIFISGGAKNGKSLKAQELAKQLAEEKNSKLFYIATMIPYDAEDQKRILRHKQEREGWGFTTVECSRDIGSLAENVRGGCCLLDSVTALLANEMFGENGKFDPHASQRVTAGLQQLLTTVKHAVIVSDAIGVDTTRRDGYTDAYCRGLAHTERAICRMADVVLEACAGNFTVHKGELP